MKPNTIWAEFWIVSGSFLYGKPTQFTWNETKKTWCHESPSGTSAMEVAKLGLQEVQHGLICYASADKEVVAVWMEVVQATSRTRDYVREEELKRWKAIAAYLASCHAATAQYDGMLKSCSSSRRKRMVCICRKAAAYLEGKDIPHAPYPSRDGEDGDVRNAVERCKRAVEEVGETKGDRS